MFRACIGKRLTMSVTISFLKTVDPDPDDEPLGRVIVGPAGFGKTHLIGELRAKYGKERAGLSCSTLSASRISGFRLRSGFSIRFKSAWRMAKRNTTDSSFASLSSSKSMRS